MRNAMRALIALVGLFNMAIGLGFLTDPARLGAAFFLSANGIQGLATMRADFTAFFVTGGTFALLGAVRGRPEPLAVPLILLAIALSARFVSLAVDGVSPTAFQPMAAEMVMIAILFVGRRTLRAYR
ncbi:MAG: hypothetical protein ABI810_17590 [Sphingomonas bacterium]